MLYQRPRDHPRRDSFPAVDTEIALGQFNWGYASIPPAIADLDGDGVRPIDARTGKILWSLSAPSPTCQRVVAADIDGRPGDELLYVAGAELIAVTGARASGRILWEWRGPASLSLPAVADADGDGLAELVVQAADGSVHCLE